MPIFDYKCIPCNAVRKNKLVKKHDEEVLCSFCQKPMIRQISVPNIGGMDNLGRSKGKS